MRADPDGSQGARPRARFSELKSPRGQGWIRPAHGSSSLRPHPEGGVLVQRLSEPNLLDGISATSVRYTVLPEIIEAVSIGITGAGGSEKTWADPGECFSTCMNHGSTLRGPGSCFRDVSANRRRTTTTLSSTEVLRQLTAEITADQHDGVIVIGSLAAAYPFGFSVHLQRGRVQDP